MSEQLMNFEKDIEPCQKQREAQDLVTSMKQPKKKIVRKQPDSIKFTKVIN